MNFNVKAWASKVVPATAVKLGPSRASTVSSAARCQGSLGSINFETGDRPSSLKPRLDNSRKTPVMKHKMNKTYVNETMICPCSSSLCAMIHETRILGLLRLRYQVFKELDVHAGCGLQCLFIRSDLPRCLGSLGCSPQVEETLYMYGVQRDRCHTRAPHSGASDSLMSVDRLGRATFKISQIKFRPTSGLSFPENIQRSGEQCPVR